MRPTTNPMKEHSSTIVFLLLLLFITIISFAATSCHNRPEVEIKPDIPQKPFVIINKSYVNSNRIKSHISYYRYVDARGKEYLFQDRDDMYHIGDTIK